MAQVVRYFENYMEFTEGPFVLCNPLGNGWRIEAELKGFHCPVFPDPSVSKLAEELGLHGKATDWKLAERVCDELNRMAKEGKICLSGASWVYPPHVRTPAEISAEWKERKKRMRESAHT